jgi:hypothetical protein
VPHYHEHDVAFFAEAGRDFCIWLHKIYLIQKYGKKVAEEMIKKEEEARRNRMASVPTFNVATSTGTMNIDKSTTTHIPTQENVKSKAPLRKTSGSSTAASTSSKQNNKKAKRTKGKGKSKAVVESEESAQSTGNEDELEEESRMDVDETDTEETREGRDKETSATPQPATSSTAHLSQYELDMQDNIARNNQLLAALMEEYGGTDQLFMDKPKVKPRPVKKKKVPQAPRSPSSLRRSSRRATQLSHKVLFLDKILSND